MAGGKRTISIALLIADTPPESVTQVRGDYLRIYTSFFQRSLATIKRHHWQEELSLDIRPSDVVNGKYPNEGQLADGLWDAICITGSASAVYEDKPWVRQLLDFVKHVAEDHPLVRIMGICWGHQAVAQALGGEVKENTESGWELGVYDCELNEDGEEIWGFTEFDEELENGGVIQEIREEDDDAAPKDGVKRLRVQEVHKDHVVEIPDEMPFVNLASTKGTPCQSLALRYPTDSPPLPSVVGTSQFIAFDTVTPPRSSGPSAPRGCHVLTLQGHPEFDTEIVELLVEAKTDMGPVPLALKEEALRRAKLPDDALKIGRRFLCMLGIEEARSEGQGIVS